jgi:hypothetical protein
MKFRNSPFILALALIVSSPLISHASACSDSTLRGSYAFTIHGSIILPDGSTLLVDGLAKRTFDGTGNFTQVDAVAVGGNLPRGWRPGSGTYSVNPDYTGSQTCWYWPQPCSCRGRHTPHHKHHRRDTKQWARLQAQRLTCRCSARNYLTEDQKARLKPILQDQAQQLRALRDDPSLSLVSRAEERQKKNYSRVNT